jgi:uncharacterized membrane protein YfcA
VTLEPLVLLALAVAGFLAGFVDAIAGGGGLIAIPALLTAGVPPIAALATTKLQSAVGTTIAVATYARNGYVDLRALWPTMLLGFAAAFLGALWVKNIDTSFLDVAVPVALIAIAVYFTVAPRLTDEDRRTRLSLAFFAPVLGFFLGFYDGGFGPGTGSFLTMGFVMLFGLGLTKAAGHTKAVNLMTNFGALALFIPSGDVIWSAAIAMATGQLAGGYLGARVGIRFGARLIRPLVIAISVILALRLLFFS